MLDNKARGEIAFPVAGEGAFLKFSVEALERLESKYGEDYLDIVVRGLSKARPSVYRACFEASLQGAGTKEFPWGKALEELQGSILDALYTMVHGRTFEEQQKHEDEIFVQRIKESQTNPRLAAALYSQVSSEKATKSGSDQENSAA